MISGAITDATFYPFLFGLAFVLSLAFLLLLVPLFRRERKAMSVEDGAGIAPG